MGKGVKDHSLKFYRARESYESLFSTVKFYTSCP